MMATGGGRATTARRRVLSKDRGPRSTTRSTRRLPPMPCGAAAARFELVLSLAEAG